ncbi:MAG: hypothetical protein KAT06_03670 [Gammaproteobacteria bacterium]|nr:hypothetical protein [Gammaproteobacteria bacterium]
MFFQFVFINPVQAGDADWLRNLSIQAKADGSGIKAKLATRFNLGGVKVNAVLSNVNGVENAYMVLRMAEMSGHDTDYVVEQYQANKGKGWGVLAKRLGIKPGSREFHNLKSAHARSNSGNDEGNSKRGKGKSRGQGKNKNKGKGRGKGKADF